MNERAIDAAAVARRDGAVQSAKDFWIAIVDGRFSGEDGTSHGLVLGLAAEALADPEMIEALKEALRRNERAETTGPILDPTAWRGRAFERNRLVSDLIRAGIALGEAEQRRRAQWGA